MPDRKRGARLVYSSDEGQVCPGCERVLSSCVCDAEQPAPSARGPVRVGRQTKGRKGKGVTVITGLPLAGAELTRLAKELKRRCGSGGTVKDGVIEIQGEHRDLLVEELVKRGYGAKRSGS